MSNNQFVRLGNRQRPVHDQIQTTVFAHKGGFRGEVPVTDAMVQDISQLFLALSDPSRLKILRVLIGSETALSRAALARSKGITGSSMGQQVKLLTKNEFVIFIGDRLQTSYLPVMPLVGRICELAPDHVASRSADLGRHSERSLSMLCKQI